MKHAEQQPPRAAPTPAWQRALGRLCFWRQPASPSAGPPPGPARLPQETFWDLAPDAFFLLDERLQVRYANAAAGRLTNKQNASLVGHPFTALVLPAECPEADLRRAVSQQQPLFFNDVEIRQPTGQPPRHASLKLFPAASGLGIIAVDVTEFRSLFSEAGEFAGFLQHAIGSANVCLHVIDRQMKTLIWNDAAATLTGYTPDECIGSDSLWFSLFPDENQRITYLDRIQQVFDGEPAFGLEAAITTKGGETRAISWHWQRVLNESEEACGGIGIGIDITRRRELEGQLLTSQKMEAIGTLAGGVAHDFNNLLTVIFGNTDLALGCLQPTDAAVPLLEEVLATAHRASSLTRQLLLFSRKQTGVPAVVNINDTISGMMKMLGRLLKEHIKIETRLDAEAPAVMADEGHLEQILMNLCINARDAMPQGGTVIITSRRVSLTGEDCKSCPQARPGSFLMISVKDSGTGIAPEIRHRIFEPFFTTKPIGQGTGLGLAVVYGVVQQMHGWITVLSEVGRGTEFDIYLPVHRDKRVPQPGDTSSAKTFQGTRTWRSRGEWVLIIEDEASLRKTLERALQEAGYLVWVAERAAEARVLFEHSRKPFSLIVSDVVLPDGNGIELLRDMKVIEKGVRVVIMTGYADDIPDIGQASAENVRLLQKPFSLDVLLQTLQEMSDPDRKKVVGIRDTTVM